PHDRLQLVRLRQAAAAAHRQRRRGVRRGEQRAGRSAVMNLLPFVQWCEASTLGNAIRTSTWAFAAIESVHLLALSAIGGAVLVVDLRLLGLGLRDQRVRDLARDA